MDFYNNPIVIEDVWEDYGIGDPFIMKYNGLYYLYSSTKDGEVGIRAYKSSDLVTWESVGYVSTEGETVSAYAPEVIYDNGLFYMVTSPGGHGHYTLVSKSPEGPFEVVTENYGRWIDGSLYVDEDGKMYFSNASPKGIEVSETSLGQNFGPGLTTACYLNHWTEGPMIIKKDGMYYMTYTGNHLDSEGYRVQYAVSDQSPLGPYEVIQEEPILINTDESYRGLGHSAAFIGPDLQSFYAVFHHSTYDQGPRVRYMSIERMFFNGSQLTIGQTYRENQPVPQRPYDETMGGDDEGYETADRGHFMADVPAGDYCAEINYIPGNGTMMIIGVLEDKQVIQVLLDDGAVVIQLQNEEGTTDLLSMVLPNEFNEDVLHTIYVDYTSNKLMLHLDALLVGEISIEGLMGHIGYVGQAADVGYCAVNLGSTNEKDQEAYKPVPGKIQAVHTVSKQDISLPIERFQGYEDSMVGGYKLMALNAATSLVYHINQLYSGEYRFYLDVFQPNGASEVVAEIGEQKIRWQIQPGLADVNGYRRYISEPVSLQAGLSNMILSNEKGDVVNLARIGSVLVAKENIDYNHSLKEVPLVSAQLLGEWRQVKINEDGLKPSSMSDEKILFGDETWDDYTYRINMRFQEVSGDGRLGLLFRSSEESYHPDQVRESAIGYFLSIRVDEIILEKWCYGVKQLQSKPYSFESDRDYEMMIEALGHQISIYIDGELVLTYEDPSPYLTGRVGIWSDHASAIFSDIEVTSDKQP